MAGFDSPVEIKTPREIKKMVECGKRLGEIKETLREMIDEGVCSYDVEEKATRLIDQTGGKPSFKMVPGYHWSTCINVNSGLVHGIPRKDLFFKKGDLVSVDIGLYFNGFHTDTSFSKGVDLNSQAKKFFAVGEVALKKSIQEARQGKRIYDISLAMEKTIKSQGYSPVRALVGHGVGRNLHEEPAIPCFTAGKREDTPEIKDGMALAIEVMYCLGSENLVLESDGWTIATADGKISALFEETVAVTPDGPLVLT
jgi:methionyl aminopeptidase